MSAILTLLDNVSSDTALSGGFSPTDISNLEAWYDASDTSTITESSNAVSQWDDKSGSATVRNVTQGTGSKQPLTNVGTINGLNVIRFDGINDGLTYTTNNLSYMTHSIFVVSDSNVNSGNDMYGSGGSLLDGDVLLMNVNNSGNKFRGHFDTGPSFNTIDSVSASVTVPTIYHQEVDSTNITIRRNGVLDRTLVLVGSPASNPRGVFIGTRDDSFAGFFSGDIAEVVVYDRDLTTSEKNQVGNYLGDKWGITWTDI